MGNFFSNGNQDGMRAGSVKGGWGAGRDGV